MFTTDGQSANTSWCEVPVWGPRPDFYYYHTLRVCWCGVPSLTRGRVCHLQLLLALANVVILGSESHRTHHILLFQILDFPNLEGGPGPCIYSPWEQGSPVMPPDTGFSFHCLLWFAGLQWRYADLPSYERDWLQQSQSYVMTDGHLSSLLWCQAPITECK
jgi:hypothetical protein